MAGGTKIKTRKLVHGTRHTALFETPGGKWKSAGTFGDRRAAEKAALLQVAKVESGQWVDPTDGRVSVRSFVEDAWIASLVVEPTTMVSYQSYLNNWILPEFGAYSINKVTPLMVQSWVARMAKTGRNGKGPAAPRTLSKAHVLLFMIFKDAQRNGMISSNPCAHTTIPTAPDRVVTILSPEQFTRMIDNLDAAWIPSVLTAIETGMRLSELRALCPAQIDWDRRTIIIDRGLVYVFRKSADGGAYWHSKPYPKGGHNRTVAVSQSTLDVLRSEMDRQGLADTSETPILMTRNGNPIGSSRINRNLRTALEKAGVPVVTAKHLRSSHASWMLAGGASLAAVQKRLGHQAAATTQLYITPIDGADAEALDAFTSIRNRSNT